MRSCILAVRLGDTLGLTEAELAEIYYLSLWRMLGCTADAHVAAAVMGDELAARAWLARTETGNPAQVLAALVRHLGEGNLPLRRATMVATAMAGIPRVVQLAQDAVLHDHFGGPQAAAVMARQRAGGAYDPRLVERFCRQAPHLLAEAASSSAARSTPPSPTSC